MAARFAGIPDVHYGDAVHWVSGDRACQWTLTGTTVDGERIAVRGCDLWTFRDGRVVRKDSYWKIVEVNGGKVSRAARPSPPRPSSAPARRRS